MLYPYHDADHALARYHRQLVHLSEFSPLVSKRIMKTIIIVMKSNTVIKFNDIARSVTATVLVQKLLFKVSVVHGNSSQSLKRSAGVKNNN